MAHPDPPDPAAAELAARRRMVLVTAVGAVVAAALLFALVAQAMSSSRTAGSSGGSGSGGNEQTALFDVGRATDRAATIARSGPILFPDPKGGTLDIYVQHLGEKDWVAFEARVRGASRQCVLTWDQGARRFTDPCDGRTYPADGAGLVTYPAKVDGKGRVIVDLTAPREPASP